VYLAPDSTTGTHQHNGIPINNGDGWVVAKGTRVFQNTGDVYVVKVTHAGGVLKVFTCLLSDAFKCELGPKPEGTSSGLCVGHMDPNNLHRTCLPSGTFPVCDVRFFRQLFC
jgi:hypothetical protein